MQIGFKADNKLVNGNPAGGYVSGTGFTISWQDGPLGQVNASEREPNGAFVEDVLEACRQRLEFYQEAANGKFACEENAVVIIKLMEALDTLDGRTKRRIYAGTEGTHKGN